MQQLLRIQAETLQKVGVLIDVDLVGKLLVRLAGLVALTPLSQQVQDRALVDLEGRLPLNCYDNRLCLTRNLA